MVKPILVLDTASPHLPKRLMSFAKRKGFQLLFVPASSTGLLQPLDTSAFSAFKHWIKRKNQQLRRTAQGGEPQQLEFSVATGSSSSRIFRQQTMGPRFRKRWVRARCDKVAFRLAKFHAESSVLTASCQTHSGRDGSHLA